uniref:Melanocortin 2 receptor accessory protein 2b n=1 Tax=Cyclopterus lumpus TaxID=8103 RepID=A0A8C3A1M3_CYCLU
YVLLHMESETAINNIVHRLDNSEKEENSTKIAIKVLDIFKAFSCFNAASLLRSLSLNRNQDSAEKRHRPGSCLVDIGSPQDENDKAFSRPLLTQSRSYFHFYINEEDPSNVKQKPEHKRVGKPGGARAQQGTRGIRSSGMDEMEDDVEEAEEHQPLKGLIEESKTDRERAFFSHFNIPNFVNLEHSSTLGEEDLLYEPSVILERQAHSQDAHCDGH